jgi:hypothetical protein
MRALALGISVVPLLICASWCSTARSQVFYRETFASTTSGGDRVSTVFNWQTFLNTGALRTDVNVNSEDMNNPGGWPRDVENTVSAGEIFGGGFGPQGRGWAYIQTGQPLMITQEFQFTPIPGSTKFSWWQLNPNAGREVRLLVQMGGGAWYASAQTFTNTNGGGGLTTWETNSQMKSLIFDPAAANWLAISFNGGFDQASTVAIPLGNPGTPATASLSGTITGFGIWHDQNASGAGTGNSRFDTFTIEGAGPPLQPGDTDGDGIPGEFPDDFEPIRANFRKAVAERNLGDLVDDNMIDFKDFHQWKDAFVGGGGSLAGLNLSFGANVPETGTAGLVLLGTMLGANFVPRVRVGGSIPIHS